MPNTLTQIAIGSSRALDPREAAQQAAIQIKTQLNTPETDLVLLFTSESHAQEEILSVIHTILRPKRLTGSCAGAVITPNGIFKNGLVMLAVNSTEITFGLGAVPTPPEADLRQAGFELGRKLTADFKATHRQAGLLFTDGISQNNSVLVRGIQEVLGSGFPLLGAVSSDDFKFQHMCQFYQKQKFARVTTGLLIGGARVNVGSTHGFKPLGKPRFITKAQSHVLCTIDDKPAVHIYEEFLGTTAAEIKKNIFTSHTLSYPLGIYMPEERQYLLKNAVDILDDGSIVCQGDVPEGAEVHLMMGNRDSCVQSALDAAQKIKEELGSTEPKFILIIESLARYQILGRRSWLEIQAIKDVLGYATPMIGMYGFGEISPFGSLHNVRRNTYMHNETILIVTVS